FVLHELDFSVWVREQEVEEILAVDAFVARAHGVFHREECLPNRRDGDNALASRDLDRAEHVEDPFLPRISVAYGAQQTIVFALRLDNKPAHVERRRVQELFLDEIEDVDDAASAAVTILERADAFELIVRDGHLD